MVCVKVKKKNAVTHLPHERLVSIKVQLVRRPGRPAVRPPLHMADGGHGGCGGGITAQLASQQLDGSFQCIGGRLLLCGLVGGM